MLPCFIKSLKHCNISIYRLKWCRFTSTGSTATIVDFHEKLLLLTIDDYHLFFVGGILALLYGAVLFFL